MKLLRLSHASIPFVIAVTVARAAPLPATTFDYTAHTRTCVLGICSTTDAPGRLMILKSGKILVYFSDSGAAGVQSNGVLLQLGRTVRLSGGRLPKTISGIVPTGGSGSARFDGRRLILSISLTGSFSVNGVTATLGYRATDVYDVDAASGMITGGTGQGSGTISGQRADGQSFSGPLTVSATLQPR